MPRYSPSHRGPWQPRICLDGFAIPDIADKWKRMICVASSSSTRALPIQFGFAVGLNCGRLQVAFCGSPCLES